MILPRRAFLRGLTTLPLIGGTIELTGQPSAVAEPVTLDLMQNYNMWLWHEHHRVGRELDEVYGLPNARFSHVHNAGAAFHCLKDWNFNPGLAPASTRAAIVLSAVGCDWKAA